MCCIETRRLARYCTTYSSSDHVALSQYARADADVCCNCEQLDDFEEFCATLRFLKTPEMQQLGLDYMYPQIHILIHHGLTILCYFWSAYYLRLLPPSQLPAITVMERGEDGKDTSISRPALVVDNQERVIKSSHVLAMEKLLASSKLKFKLHTLKLGNVVTRDGRGMCMSSLLGGGAGEKAPLLQFVSMLRRFADKNDVCRQLLESRLVIIADRGYLKVKPGDLPEHWNLWMPPFLHKRHRFEIAETFTAAVRSCPLSTVDRFPLRDRTHRLRLSFAGTATSTRCRGTI